MAEEFTEICSLLTILDVNARELQEKLPIFKNEDPNYFRQDVGDESEELAFSNSKACPKLLNETFSVSA